MRTHRVFGFVIAASAAIGAAHTVKAQDGDRTVEQYTCKDVMRESGSARDVAVAFLHGYLIGKGGASKFNVGTIQKQTDSFVEGCLDNPNAKAVDVMVKVKG